MAEGLKRARAAARKTRQKPEPERDLIIAGEQMSNWLYNMGQHSDFSALSSQIKEMVNKWDAAKIAYRSRR